MSDVPHPTDTPDVLEDYLRAFREGWIKAGPPGPQATIAMVHEVMRLRERVAELEAKDAG